MSGSPQHRFYMFEFFIFRKYILIKKEIKQKNVQTNSSNLQLIGNRNRSDTMSRKNEPKSKINITQLVKSNVAIKKTKIYLWNENINIFCFDEEHKHRYSFWTLNTLLTNWWHEKNQKKSLCFFIRCNALCLSVTHPLNVIHYVTDKNFLVVKMRIIMISSILFCWHKSRQKNILRMPILESSTMYLHFHLFYTNWIQQFKKSYEISVWKRTKNVFLMWNDNNLHKPMANMLFIVVWSYILHLRPFLYKWYYFFLIRH